MDQHGDVWVLVKQYPFLALVVTVVFLVISAVSLLHCVSIVLELLAVGARLFRHAWGSVQSAWSLVRQELPARKQVEAAPAVLAPSAVEFPAQIPPVPCERQLGRFLIGARSIKATRERRTVGDPIPASFAIQGRRLSGEVRE